MKFSDFKSVEDVQAKYPLIVLQESFLPNITLDLPAFLQDDLNFALRMRASTESEMFFREYFIAPFLREVWKRHPKLKLWVNRKLAYQDELIGEPDYFVSALQRHVATTDPVGKPLLAIAEAKQEDFIQGWGQCLAEMIACQKLNGNDGTIIYGIVSTGEFWQFGKLDGETFTRHLDSYSIREPNYILGALDYLFTECERQIKPK